MHPVVVISEGYTRLTYQAECGQLWLVAFVASCWGNCDRILWLKLCECHVPVVTELQNKSMITIINQLAIRQVRWLGISLHFCFLSVIQIITLQQYHPHSRPVHYSTVQYSTVQYSKVQYSAVQPSFPHLPTACTKYSHVPPGTENTNSMQFVLL